MVPSHSQKWLYMLKLTQSDCTKVMSSEYLIGLTQPHSAVHIINGYMLLSLHPVGSTIMEALTWTLNYEVIPTPAHQSKGISYNQHTTDPAVLDIDTAVATKKASYENLLNAQKGDHDCMNLTCSNHPQNTDL